eukprot:745058-Amphidinium_carterae.1
MSSGSLGGCSDVGVFGCQALMSGDRLWRVLKSLALSRQARHCAGRSHCGHLGSADRGFGRDRYAHTSHISLMIPLRLNS